jgi:hypothetical protein
MADLSHRAMRLMEEIARANRKTSLKLYYSSSEVMALQELRRKGLVLGSAFLGHRTPWKLTARGAAYAAGLRAMLPRPTSLAEMTRRASVPGAVVQIYKAHPVFLNLLEPPDDGST